MDFAYDSDQQTILDLAEQILRDGCTQERLRQIERSDGPRFDRELWQKLGEAGLLGIAVPEEFGGAGLGFLEVAGVVERVGRSVAPVPYLESVVLGMLPLAEFGSAAQKKSWLPRAARGEAILSAALVEASGVPDEPHDVQATRAGAGWTLRGIRHCVPAAELADLLLVSAASAEGPCVFLVDPKAKGLRLTALATTSGQPESRVDFDGVSVGAGDLLGSPGQGRAIVAWMLERANAALASLSLGLCSEALKLTADYAKTRKQFDQPIAMFQAVGHRAAGAYIDTEGVRLTALQAAWRLGTGLPAAKEVAIAKHWACEAGSRVVHAAQHLHGGVGVDRDYPLHRYFLYARQLELTLGGSTQHLRGLGALLAAEVA